MHAGIIAIGFGEPPSPEAELVESYLQRIFLENMAIEGDMPRKRAIERAEDLASRRVDDLIEEYEAIGGSPLQDHLAAHIDRLGQALHARGHEVETYLATQYFRPTIDDAVEAAKEVGHQRIVLLPMYPLCGPSTTVAAIDAAATSIEATADWSPGVFPIGGWHRHPRYNRLRADNTANYAAKRNLDLQSDDTSLVFSAHGTPTSYLEQGSRYVTYVEEYCEAQAALLGGVDYVLGYQNHESRGVEWTQPDLETAVANGDATNLVVEPVSFIHEQSETLYELDVELEEVVSERGKSLHRVPVPHEDPALAEVLADIVEPAISGIDPQYYGLKPCQCSSTPGTMCLCSPASVSHSD